MPADRPPTNRPPKPKPAAAADDAPRPELPPWQPVTRRARLLLLALALLAALVVTVLMAGPKLALMAARAARGEPPTLSGANVDSVQLRCPPHAASIAAGCPGGPMNIVVVPPAPPGR